MRADLQRTMLRRKAQACSDPVQKVLLLREVVELAEEANDYPMFSAVLKEYEAAVLACPGSEVRELVVMGGPFAQSPAPRQQVPL